MTTSFWRHIADGIEIAVRATPKGGRDAIEGIVRDANGAAWLAVRVTLAADGGKATAAVGEMLARYFHCRNRDVVLVSGATSRLKRFRILGDPEELGGRAAQLEGS